MVSKEKIRADHPESELHRFLSKYGETPDIQMADEAETDAQIKNLIPCIAESINESNGGTVLDIGCGSGIVLKRLGVLELFGRKTAWIYAGADFEEKRKPLLELAVDLSLHRRSEFIALDELYANWISPSSCPLPRVVVIRNVLHELDILQTSVLLHTLALRLQPTDKLVLQDLQVFPTGERGNACWHLPCLMELLKRNGFDAFNMEEPTPRGNRWFTIIARRTEQSGSTQSAVFDAVREERLKQYNLWQGLDSLVPVDTRLKQVGLVDLDLQLAALAKQLRDAKVPGIGQPTPEKQSDLAKATFTAHLRKFDPAGFATSIVTPEKPVHFRNRAHAQDALEDFLRSSSQVAVLRGGPLMGKTYLVREVLAHRAHSRQTVMLDILATSNSWNLIEQYMSAIGCSFPYDLIGGFPNIKFDAIVGPLEELVHKAAGYTVLVFDHFERSLDPNGDIADPEIKQFIQMLATIPSAKLIVTTRRAPNLDFLPPSVLGAEQPLVGRFPQGGTEEGFHVENIIGDFIDPPEDGFPKELISAIDRHPYLAVVAGQYLKSARKESLTNPEFLALLRNRLRDEILRQTMTLRARPVVSLLSTLRIPVPRAMLESLAGKDNVREAEELGLAYPVFGPLGRSLMTGIALLRPRQETTSTDETLFGNDAESAKVDHAEIAKGYSRLYREDDDPRWLREIHYHTLAGGDRREISQFGAAYTGELFGAGEYWFHVRRDPESALWAFQTAKQRGFSSYFLDLRLAACLVRAGKRVDGEELYDSLLTRYPTARGVKTSYVDSLLAIRDHAGALEKLTSFHLGSSDSAWIAHEYGRAYLGLHRYRDAVEAFKTQLTLRPEAIVFHMLARAYHRTGDQSGALQTLVRGLRLYPRDRRLELDYAAHLVRLGDSSSATEAKAILLRLLERYPSNGPILQQLCKLLCQQGRVDEAQALIDGTTIWPERYQTPIRVEIFIARRMFENALSLLRDISADNEHLVGLKRKVYLRWARSVENPAQRRSIASRGLTEPLHQPLRANIPIMVTCARLANLAEDHAAFDSMLDEIEVLNGDVARLLRDEEEGIAYWEEEPFE